MKNKKSKNQAPLPTLPSISVPAPYRIRVFLDVDGVIADFDGWCEELWNAGSRDLKCRDEHGNDLNGDAALWWHVDREPRFWLDMPIKGGAQELIEIARPYGAGFLTGCPRQGYDRAEREKRVKLQTVAPDLHVITCLSRNKMLHMQEPGDILVDDMVGNIRKWEKAGGTPVFYKTHKQAVADLKSAIERQFGKAA